jgi:hypothetical protein
MGIIPSCPPTGSTIILFLLVLGVVGVMFARDKGHARQGMQDFTFSPTRSSTGTCDEWYLPSCSFAYARAEFA